MFNTLLGSQVISHKIKSAINNCNILAAQSEYMMSIGYFFAFGAALCWSIGAFPLTIASRQMDINSMNHLRLFIATILLSFIALFYDSSNFIHLFSFEYSIAWFYLGVSGVLSLVVGDYLSFKSFSILGPQQALMLTTFSPASALIAGIILIDEHVNVFGIIGMLITIVGVMTISLGRSERNAIPDHGFGSISKGILFGLLASACHGIALAFGKLGINEQKLSGQLVGPFSATFIRLFVSALFLITLTLISGKIKVVIKNVTTVNDGLKNALFGTIFNPTFALTFAMLAIMKINVAVAQTIFATVPMFTLVIGYFYYKKKISVKAVLGVLASLVGVGLLVWQDELLTYF